MTRLLSACLALMLSVTVAGCANSSGWAQPAPSGPNAGWLSNPMAGGGG